MTMEEWLRSQRENAEIFGAAAKERGAEAEKAYYDGMMEAIDALLSNLPEFEHEVTLREVSELCGDCSNCPYPVSPANPAGCYLNDTPDKWPVDEIEKRVKEARKNKCLL